MEKKKKIKTIKKELTQAERHFGVILEDIDSKLDLFIKLINGILIKFEKRGY